MAVAAVGQAPVGQVGQAPVGEECVDAVLARLAALPSGHPSTWDLAQLRTGIPDLFEIGHQIAALQLAAVASYDARGGAQIDGHRTTGDWLGKRTRVSDGGARVQTARDLRDHLPATAQALRDGVISMEHVRAIRRAYRMFDRDFAGIEVEVVEFAKTHSVKLTRAFIDKIIQQYAPDPSEDTAEARREQRKLFLSQSMDGWWHMTGLLDPATGHSVQAALDTYSQPVSADDRRSPAMRRADALAEIADRSLDTTDRPTGFGHVTLTLTPDQLRTGLAATWPTGLLASRTDTHTAACSACVTYVVGLPTDHPVRWQPLNVGFALRYATKAQRAALAVRDGNGCAHPGCTVPAWRCVAHHIRPWDQGGRTDLRNMVLLCRYHHRRVHLARLRITWIDGRATTTETNRAPPTPTPSP